MLSDCCMSVCCLDKVKMLDYINYEKEKRVYNFHQSKPWGCSNDNVCYSR